MLSKEERRANLEKELEETKEKLEALRNHPEDFGNDVDDFDEETDEAESFSAQVGEEELLKEKIRTIQQDLEDLEHE